MILLLLVAIPAYANNTDNSTSTQTNTSGSNTSISGSYTSTTTNNNDGQTNTTTSTTTNAATHNNSTNNKSTIPVPTASAPSMSSYSQDLCTIGIGAGVQVPGLGVSAGTYYTDANCERMKLSKLLYDFNMRVAAIAILCQDDRIFSAMDHAGTPCPFEGQIGAAAKEQWKKYDVERPDYARYTKNLRRRAAIDARLQKVLEKRVDSNYELYGDDE